MLQVSASSLRNWERMGLLSPTRSTGRYRLYSSEAVRQLRRILYLRRVRRVNPAGILQMRGRDDDLRSLPAPSQPGIGERLGRLREQLGLTRADAAARAGLTPAFVAAVERGKTQGSIASLHKLAHVYGTNVLAFFETQPNVRHLVRPRDRGVLSETGVRMELLAFGALQMQAMLFRLSPRAKSGGSYHHEGEEFIYMLSGKFEIWLDELEHYILEPGDSLYFPSTRAHRWGAVGDEEATLLWINSPPTF